MTYYVGMFLEIRHSFGCTVDWNFLLKFENATTVVNSNNNL